MFFTSGLVGLCPNLEISRYLEIVHFQSRILEIEKTRDFRNTSLDKLEMSESKIIVSPVSPENSGALKLSHQSKFRNPDSDLRLNLVHSNGINTQSMARRLQSICEASL